MHFHSYCEAHLNFLGTSHKVHMNFTLHSSHSDNDKSDTDTEGEMGLNDGLCHCDDNSPVVSSSTAAGSHDVISIVPYSSSPDNQEEQDEYVCHLIFKRASTQINNDFLW